MKNKNTYQILLTLGIILLFAVSLQSISAAEIPITDDAGDGGIQTGLDQVTDADNVLLLAPGTYTGADNTGLILNKSVTIKGNGNPTEVTIDADESNRIFTIDADDLIITFENLTFANGYGADFGGAIYNSYSGTTLTFINCIFTNNQATHGGAINNNGNDLTILNSIFEGNEASSNGGAIYNSGNGMQIDTTTFTNNQATYGGAVYNDGYDVIIENSIFDTNKASNTGGAIYNNGNLNLTSNTMPDNEADELANVIYNAGTIGNLNLTYLDNLDINNNTEISLKATLTDDMGNPITGGNITFYVNNTLEGSVVVEEGEAICPFTTNKPGIVTVDGDYTLIGDYELTVLAGTLEVNKVNTNSTINVNSPNTVIKVNDTGVTISGIVTGDGNGVDDITIKIDITFNGITETRETTTNQGSWSIPYKPENAGIYTVKVYWDEITDDYNGFTNDTGIFSVDKLITYTTIEVPEVDATKVNDTIIISGVITDEKGNNVSGIFVTVDINGDEYTNTTDEEGYWEIEFTPETAGNYLVTVTWDDEANYYGSPEVEPPSATFNVLRLDTYSTIVVPNLIKIPATAKEGAPVNFTGVLTDEKNNAVPYAEVTITIKSNTTTLITNTTVTDENGTWIFTYIPTVNGTLTIEATFEGDEDYYYSTENSTNFNVIKGKVIVTMNTTDYPDGSYAITATVIDDDNNSVSGYPVEFYKDGVFLGREYTNRDGLVTILVDYDTMEHEYKVIVPEAEIDESSENSITYKSEELPEEGDKDEPKNDANNSEPKESEVEDHPDEEVKSPSAGAAMKNTGIPIVAILIVLLSSLGLVHFRKK